MKARHLLVCTRFSPLGQTGTATYLFGILRQLRAQGFRITVCWSDQPSVVWRRGWWVVPRDIAQIATLILPGGICLGRLRLFPGAFLDPLRRRLRAGLKKTLLSLGLGRLLGLRETPLPEAETFTSTMAELFPWNRPPDPFEFAFFGRALARLRPHAVLTNYCWLNPVFRDAPAGCLKGCLTLDLCHEYSILVDGRIVRIDGATLTRDAEAAYLRQADLVVAIREDDAETFRQLAPGKEVLTVYPAFPAVPARRPPEPHRVLFIAADNEPNREGIAWFLRDAWPKVRAAHPAAELHVCGTICKHIPPHEPGVLARGFVDSLDAVYDEAAVVIVPLLRGSGVKIKLMEALAHGKACISTPIGVEGVPALEGAVAVAGRAEDFAAHVARLLANETARHALEERALAVIRTHFTPEACCGPLTARILQTVS